MIHIHLVGGPDDGEVLEFDMEDEEDTLPDMVIMPVNDTDGELYEYSDEKSSCGATLYLYSGYDWKHLLPFRRSRKGRRRKE